MDSRSETSGDEQSPQPNAPSTQGSLVSEFSFVNVEVPVRTASRPTSATPLRRAMVAEPVILSHNKKSSTVTNIDYDIEAGGSSGSAGGEGCSRIKTSDVANIFRASTTLQTVTDEQIERIEKSK